MNKSAHVIQSVIVFVVVLAITLWVGFKWLRRSADPGKFIAKLVGTGANLAIIGWLASSPGAMTILLIVPPAVFIGLIWAPEVAGFFASPLTSMIDGGNVPPELKAVYSRAVAKRKKGEVKEAVAEIQSQLEEFPGDFDGMMLLCDIQAEDLRDLPAAIATIEDCLAVVGLKPGQISLALNTLADLHLKHGLDPDSARAALSRIDEMLPNTEFAFNASQRMAHLPTRESLTARHQERRIAMPTKRPLNAGPPAAKEDETLADVEAEIAEWMRHLAVYPQDQEAREQLAQIFARKLDSIDRAREQYEHLLKAPNVPARTMVRWLDTLATLEIQVAVDEIAARATIQRIIDLYPGTAHAEQAQQRLNKLGLELKGNERRKGLKLGNYERDIGLKPKST